MKGIGFVWRYLFSFVWPVVVERRQGEVSALEVALSGGRYRLNSATVNYSFGGLHRVFQRVFSYMELRKRKVTTVLMLGFGAGSVADILEYEYGKKCRIMAVEKDPAVVELYKKYFRQSETVSLLTGDAVDFIEEDTKTYDLIIVDVFEDYEMPLATEKAGFIQSLKKRMHPGSLLLWNRLEPDLGSKIRNDRLLSLAGAILGPVETLSMDVNGWVNVVMIIGA